jgi:uncharacterized protein YjbI with pentapeptide repeats
MTTIRRAATGVALSLGLLFLPAPVRAQSAPSDGGEGQSQACATVTHSGTDYRTAATAGQNFAGQDLTGADFRGTDLTGSDFEGATLTGADLSGATLGAANGQMTAFTNANLTNACLDGVTITGSSGAPGGDFQFANLTCAAITDSDLTAAVFGPLITAAAPGGSCRTSFAASKMTCEFLSQWKVLDLSYADVSACADQLAGLDLSDAVMVGVQFSYDDLTQTDFSGADVSSANFYSAVLSHAKFTGANLQYATLSSVTANSADFSNQARLSGATLSYGDFENASFATAILEQSNDIPGATLSFADFHGADFTQAAMVGVNLSGASLYDGTVMNSATIENANFSNATLWSLSLPKASLQGITFDYANLINANLAGATLAANGTYRAASLVKANLQGVDMTQTDLAGVNMANAAVALADGVPLFALTDGLDDLESDMDKGWLTAELASAFAGSGFAMPPCSSPGVTSVQAGSWLVTLRQLTAIGPSSARYRDFVLTTLSGNDGVTGVTVNGVDNTGMAELFTVDGDFTQALNNKTLPRALYEAFQSNRYDLPACADPVITAHRASDSWTVETSLTDTTSSVVGYTGFNLVTLSDTELKVYGTQVTTLYQGTTGQLTFTTFTVAPTQFDTDYFSDTTVTPNGNTYGANLAAGVDLDSMMTAPSPPAPPACAPGSGMCP